VGDPPFLYTLGLTRLRLGVGAPIPSSTGTHGHETMKLKGKLGGKKRAWEAADSGNVIKAAQSDDDEEESRAGAIRKRARVDPFAGSGAKEKKKKKVAHDLEQTVSSLADSSAKHSHTETRSSVEVEKSLGKSEDDAIESSPSKKKKKKRKEKNDATISEGHLGSTLPQQTLTKRATISETPPTPPSVKPRTLDIPGMSSWLRICFSALQSRISAASFPSPRNTCGTCHSAPYYQSFSEVHERSEWLADIELGWTPAGNRSVSV
jgi:hypothetical protein